MPPYPCMKWAEKDYVDKAPVWCSVDLRDGNQALVVPMTLEQKIGFFKLLCKPGKETLLEVLMFVVARHMIIEETSTMENLTSIITIGLLFVIDRFLLSNPDSPGHSTGDGGTSVFHSSTPDEKKEQADFPFDKEGLQKAIQWLNEKYEEGTRLNYY